jgi:hypothetical protein
MSLTNICSILNGLLGFVPVEKFERLQLLSLPALSHSNISSWATIYLAFIKGDKKFSDSRHSNGRNETIQIKPSLVGGSITVTYANETRRSEHRNTETEF